MALPLLFSLPSIFSPFCFLKPLSYLGIQNKTYFLGKDWGLVVHEKHEVFGCRNNLMVTEEYVYDWWSWQLKSDITLWVTWYVYKIRHMIQVQNKKSCDQNPQQKTHKNSHMYNVTKSHDSDTTIQYKVIVCFT